MGLREKYIARPRQFTTTLTQFGSSGEPGPSRGPSSANGAASVPIRQSAMIADCGLQIADYQTVAIPNPHSAIPDHPVGAFALAGFVDRFGLGRAPEPSGAGTPLWIMAARTRPANIGSGSRGLLLSSG